MHKSYTMDDILKLHPTRIVATTSLNRAIRFGSKSKVEIMENGFKLSSSDNEVACIPFQIGNTSTSYVVMSKEALSALVDPETKVSIESLPQHIKKLRDGAKRKK